MPKTRRSQWNAGAGSVLALALALSGCGGGGDDPPDDSFAQGIACAMLFGLCKMSSGFQPSDIDVAATLTMIDGRDVDAQVDLAERAGDFASSLYLDGQDALWVFSDTRGTALNSSATYSATVPANAANRYTVRFSRSGTNHDSIVSLPPAFTLQAPPAIAIAPTPAVAQLVQATTPLTEKLAAEIRGDCTSTTDGKSHPVRLAVSLPAPLPAEGGSAYLVDAAALRDALARSEGTNPVANCTVSLHLLRQQPGVAAPTLNSHSAITGRYARTIVLRTH